jgi:S-adenosylmethionine decarboxylase
VFFEGPEKKFEIIVKEGTSSLRQGPINWEKIVSCSKAEILSRQSNDFGDAYLLSESSLFVYDDRAVMITCGQTTLAEAAKEAIDRVGKENIEALFFERKNEFHSEYQPSNFLEDFQLLNGTLAGEAMRFGPLDGHHLNLFCTKQPVKAQDDYTLEILMYGIPGPIAERFNRSQVGSCDRVREITGIDKILDGFAVDDYLFDPLGYSLNAMKGSDYYTVHVTPQKTGSYVSFETNHVNKTDIEKITTKVLEIFQPRSFDLLYFGTEPSSGELDIPYIRRSEVKEVLNCGYHVDFFSHFKEFESSQKAERIPL